MANEKVSRIAFSELPPNIQEKIEIILKHRRSIRNFSPVVVALPTISALLALGSYSSKDPFVHSFLLPAGIGATIGTTILDWGVLLGHKNRYSKEERKLFHALKTSTAGTVQQLCSSFSFIVVNRKGDLVGKNWNPKIGFVPIGRRRGAVNVSFLFFPLV